MKNNLFLLVINLIFATQIKGQDLSSFKRDSTNLANQKVLLDLQKQVLDLSQSINNLPNQNKSNELKEQVENIKAIQGLFGDSKPTALSGNISITDGKTTTAEARKLVFDLLDTKIGEIKTAISMSGKSKIIIAFPDLYNSMPQYFSVKKGLDELKDKFTKFRANLLGGGAPASPLAAIAAGITVVNAVAQLATLFRTDTEIIVNDEVLDESTLVAMLSNNAKLSNNTTQTYYYPSVYPMNLTKFSNSGILKVIQDIENLRLDILDILNTKRRNVESAQKEVDNKTIEINDKKIELSKEPSSTRAAKRIKSEIEQKETDLKTLQIKLKFVSSIADRDSKEFDKLDAIFSDAKNKLETVVDKEKSFSALSIFVRVEGIISEIDDNSGTLIISAKAKGTNKITKFLWSSSLKTSASIELSFLLLDKDGKILVSNAFTDYKTIKN